MILSMKTKIFKLFAVLLLSLTFTSCSLLEGMSGGSSGGTTEPGVVEKKVTKLSLDHDTLVSEYALNQDFVKPTVIATYEDDTTEDVSSQCTFSGYDMSKLGTQKVTVKFKNHTLTYSITVSENGPGKKIKGLSFEDGESVKRKYYVGEDFVKPTVIATYVDDTTEDVTEKATFTGYDLSKEGKQKVTVKYGNFTLTYNITVEERYKEEQDGVYLSDYSKLLVVGEPYRFYYYKKDETGEIYRFDNETMSYGHAEYSVDDESIVSIDQKGHIKALKAGNTYLYCIGHYNDGSVLFEFRCEIKVEEKQIVKLDISNYRDKYYTGKAFNFMCTAIATYQSGYQEEVTPTVDSSNVNMSVPGEYDVSISYEINGSKLTVNKKVTVLDASAYTLEKTTPTYTINDYLRNSSEITAMPGEGTTKMLVIPVKFTDSDTYISNYENVRQDINTAFFGTNEEVGWRSVKSFYEEESKNEVTITGVTSDWYESGKSSTDCGKVSSTIANIKDNAIDWFFAANPSEDRKSYDSDHDGYLDGVYLVYGAPDYVTGGYEWEGKSNMWAMVITGGMLATDVNNPISSKFMWASYDMIYPTKASALERTGKSDYSYSGRYESSAPSYLGLDTRTFIHESGHMFGLMDYYSSTEDSVFYAGHSNIQTMNFLSHDPYSVMLYGWAEPYVPEFSQTITINDFQQDHEFIMLRPTTSMSCSPFDEYILIDLYAPTGLNEYFSVDHPLIYSDTTKEDLTTPGVRIWHVDSRLATKDSGYLDITTNPTIGDVSRIADNSYSRDKYLPEAYDEFVELELVRNNPEAELRTLSYNKYTDYFYPGDTFDMETFKKQFANGNKLDSGLDLGWTIKIDGIYKTTTGYSADITVTKL